MDSVAIVTLSQQVILVVAMCGVYSLDLGWFGWESKSRQWVAGILFGLAAGGVMLLPVQITDGVIVDLRTAVLALAPIYGGGWAGILAGSIAAVFRLAIGGNGAFTGVCVIGITVALGYGLFCCQRRGISRKNHWQYLMLGVLTHLASVFIMWLLLPEAIGTQIVHSVGVPLVVFGALATWGMSRILDSSLDRYLNTRKVADDAVLLDVLLRGMPDLVWMKDTDGRYVFCNRRFEDFCGLTQEELQGKTDFDVFPAELAQFFKTHDDAAAHTNSPQTNTEDVTFAKDRHKERLETVKTAVRSADNSLLGVLGVARNITPREQMQRQLQQSESFFRQLFAQSGVAMVSMSPDGKVESANPYVQQLIGHSEQEILNNGYEKFIYPDDLPLANAIFEELLSGKTNERRFELRIRHKSGRPIPMLANAFILRTADGTPIRLFWSGHDLRELHSKRAELQLAERRYRLALNSIPALFVIYDANLRIRFVNKAIRDFTEISVPDILGRTDQEVFPESVYSQYLQSLQQARETAQDTRVESFVTLPQGDRRRLSMRCVPIVGEDGQVQELIRISHDLTESYQASEQIHQQAERLRRLLESSIHVITQLGELRDPYTAGHERRVAAIAVAIAHQLGLSESQQEGIRIGALLHDVGKFSVPTEILTYPGKLSQSQMQLIQEHPQTGYEVLRSIEFPWPIADIAHQHHERFDGSGYPRGLKGEEIKLEARIVAVADVVEAMSSHRPYRPSRGLEPALQEIEAGSGTRYDPVVAAACLHVFRQTDFTIPE